MDFGNVPGIGASLAALFVAIFAYRRGSRADKAKDETDNVRAVVSGFQALVDGLQSETARVSAGLLACQARETGLLLRIAILDEQVRQVRTELEAFKAKDTAAALALAATAAAKEVSTAATDAASHVAAAAADAASALASKPKETP